MPALLAAVTIAGLLSAIIGTGVWHLLSWAMLCLPLYVMMKYGAKYFK